MAEISIKIDAINDAIKELQTLQGKCSSTDISAPGIVGGGQTVNELEAIASLFKTTRSSLEMLIQSTTAFLQNVRDSYTSSDTKAAIKIAKK